MCYAVRGLYGFQMLAILCLLGSLIKKQTIRHHLLLREPEDCYELR